ncbi:MAG: EamA family transporter, partial [Acidobacteriota bacterium]
PLVLALLLLLGSRVPRLRRLLGAHGTRAPGVRTFAALGVGMVGIAVLTAPGFDPNAAPPPDIAQAAVDASAIVELRTASGDAPIHLPAAFAVLLACVSWAIGSLYARDAPLPASPSLTSGMQMLAGGGLLMLVGAAMGELASFQPGMASARSIVAVIYLIVFGSVIAFSAYSWLVRTVDPTLVSTYAFVNPIIAVLLGWLLLDEPVGWRTLIAGVLIVGAVVLLYLERRAVAVRPAPTVSTPSTANPEPSP